MMNIESIGAVIAKLRKDDITQEVCTFAPTPSFTAMLIFVRELIDKPNCFSYNLNGRKKH